MTRRMTTERNSVDFSMVLSPKKRFGFGILLNPLLRSIIACESAGSLKRKMGMEIFTRIVCCCQLIQVIWSVVSTCVVCWVQIHTWRGSLGPLKQCFVKSFPPLVGSWNLMGGIKGGMDPFLKTFLIHS